MVYGDFYAWKCKEKKSKLNRRAKLEWRKKKWEKIFQRIPLFYTFALFIITFFFFILLWSYQSTDLFINSIDQFIYHYSPFSYVLHNYSTNPLNFLLFLLAIHAVGHHSFLDGILSHLFQVWKFSCHRQYSWDRLQTDFVGGTFLIDY